MKNFKIKCLALKGEVCCSPDVVALRVEYLFNRPKGRGIKPLRHE